MRWRSLSPESKGGRRMTYNVGPCRDCGEVVERDCANICFECWAVVDGKSYVEELMEEE